MAHAGEEIALRARRGFGLTLRHAQLIDQGALLLRIGSLGLVRLLEVLRVTRELGLRPLAFDAHRHAVGNGRHRILNGRRILAPGEYRHDADQLRVHQEWIPRKGHDAFSARPVGIVQKRIDAIGRSQQRCPLLGDRPHRQNADRHLCLRTIELRVGARARLELEHPLAVVQRPDPGESPVEMLHQRFSALLEHGAQLGAAGQDEADGGGQRCHSARIVLGLLPRPNLLLERGRAVRRLPHLGEAADARHHEKDVFEDHPGRVLQPPPLAGRHDAVHRLWPEIAAQHVIERDDDRGRNENPPITIEGQEGQRAEHVKVRFDAPACEMDEERAHQPTSCWPGRPSACRRFPPVAPATGSTSVPAAARRARLETS